MDHSLLGLAVELGLKTTDFDEIFILSYAVLCYIFLKVDVDLLQLLHAIFFLCDLFLQSSQFFLDLS